MYKPIFVKSLTILTPDTSYAMISPRDRQHNAMDIANRQPGQRRIPAPVCCTYLLISVRTLEPGPARFPVLLALPAWSPLHGTSRSQLNQAAGTQADPHAAQPP